ncbi:MAG: hypothetical protein ACJ76F_08185 [Bacteroidia bacterium]
MKNRIIHPEHEHELSYWAGKWGISVRQLELAIIDTGQVNAKFLKDHLRDRGLLFSFSNFFSKLKKCGNMRKDRGYFSTGPAFNFFSSSGAHSDQSWHTISSNHSIQPNHETAVRLHTCSSVDNDALLQR